MLRPRRRPLCIEQHHRAVLVYPPQAVERRRFNNRHRARVVDDDVAVDAVGEVHSYLLHPLPKLLQKRDVLFAAAGFFFAVEGGFEDEVDVLEFGVMDNEFERVRANESVAKVLMTVFVCFEFDFTVVAVACDEFIETDYFVEVGEGYFDGRFAS